MRPTIEASGFPIGGLLGHFAPKLSETLEYFRSCGPLLQTVYALLVLSPFMFLWSFLFSSSSKKAKKWDASSLSQADLMHYDEVIVVDEHDNITGHASKKDSHIFSPSQPRGVLHRAFSVFLFDSDTGDLLLQQRASHKVTFPDVWTNTCCSHPLHGMDPPEVDAEKDVLLGNVQGVKRAAVRKLKQELGLDCAAAGIGLNDFKYLTRMHYWAADTVTHGSSAPWGEHEIDFVLFCVCPRSTIEKHLNPNPDEVSGVQWVSKQALVSGMKEGLWSPWFRIIADRWLLPASGWWTDLDATMTTQAKCDYTTINRFDPPPEHAGGAGRAPRLFLEKMNDTTNRKQGGYGRVKIHKHSKVLQLMRLSEVAAAVNLLYVNPLTSNLSEVSGRFDPEALAFCDSMLGKVSRSFAAVIRQLPKQLLVETMVFYLVLRALDTIEDDMEFFPSHAAKIQELEKFCSRALSDPDWECRGVGEGDERKLLEEFGHVRVCFQALDEESRRVILDITVRMARGMGEYIGKDLGQGTENVKEYNRYCHFVAGLVGEGLSRLFAVSGLEEKRLASQVFLSDQMGLFLQKTNILRDYLEDYVDGRAFWPASVWKTYAKNDDLGYFRNDIDAGVMCLNELVTDALELAPDCLAYLSQLRCAEVFRFCAIPQVMAIATLSELYGNPKVFTGVVKIRKGLSCKLILNTTDAHGVHDCFARSARSIKARALRTDDPSRLRTVAACDAILEIVGESPSFLTARRVVPALNVLAGSAIAGAADHLWRRSDAGAWGDGALPKLKHTGDVAALGLLVAAIMYLLAFAAFGLYVDELPKGKRVKRSASLRELTAAATIVS